ncbi:hypothetical protein C1N70_06255 [Cytobacillus firmus]
MYRRGYREVTKCLPDINIFYTAIETEERMMILKITDSARDLLKKILQEKNTGGIRVYFAGFG